MYDVIEICQYVIDYCYKNEMSMSCLKLQKALYFIQASFLVEKNIPCFDEKIMAYDFGVVVEKAYATYKMYGAGTIPSVGKYYDCYIAEEDKKIIRIILSEISQYSNPALNEIIFHQTPWSDAYSKGKGTVITNEALVKFFKE